MSKKLHYTFKEAKAKLGLPESKRYATFCRDTGLSIYTINGVMLFSREEVDAIYEQQRIEERERREREQQRLTVVPKSTGQLFDHPKNPSRILPTGTVLEKIEAGFARLEKMIAELASKVEALDALWRDTPKERSSGGGGDA